MNTDSHYFIDDLLSFTEKSLRWCAEESEKSASGIAEAVQIILNDTERVSHLSEESLAAVKAMKHQLVEGLVKKSPEASAAPTNGSAMNTLIVTLKSLLDENEDMRNIIDPIIHSLQFQDRLRQNLENLVKHIEPWLEVREKIALAGTLNQVDQDAFVKKLYDNTTMSEERDLIEKFFPETERPKETAGSDLTFF